MGIILQYKILHQPGRDNATAERSEEADERLPEKSLSDHEHHYEKSHAERRTEIGK